MIERDDELREEMVYEEEDCTEESFDGGVDIAHFGNCSAAEQLDPKLQLFVEKMQKINN
jgi:hypothetical protein